MPTKQYIIDINADSATTAAAKMGQVDNSIRGVAASAAKMAAAYIGVGGVVAAIKFSVQAAAEAEAAERRLSLAYGRNIDALMAYAKARQQVTIYEDDASIAALGTLAAYTKNEQILKKALKAAQDWAAFTGDDLNTAAEKVARTIGSDSNAFARLGIEVIGAANSMERAQDLFDEIERKAGGQSEVIDTATARWERMKIVIGNAAEFIGDKIINATYSLFDTNSFVDSFERTFNLAKDKIVAGGIAELPGINVAFDPKAAAAAQKAAADEENEIAAERLAFQTGIWQQMADGSAAHLVQIESDGQAQIDVSNGVVVSLEAELGANMRLREAQDLAAESAERLRQRRMAVVQGTATMLGSFAQLNAAMRGNATLTKRMAQSEALINTYAGGTRALRDYPAPLSFIMLAAVIAQGLAQVAQIQAQNFADGGWVRGPGGSRSDSVPTRLSAGERVLSAREIAMMGGRGAVDAIAAGKMGGGVVINLTGPVDREWFRDTAVPEITRTLRRALA